MRKIAVIAAVVALAATTAFAYPGGKFGGQGGPCGGPCYEQGAGFGGAGAPCGGPGYGRGAQGNADAQPVDDAGAKAKVQEYLDTNLKGFEIADAIKVERPRGSMYKFTVKDDNGNQFLLVVNPFGYLRGPIPVQSIK